MIAAMPERAEPRFASGLLMLADISGYTSFLAGVAEAHPDLAAAVEPVPPAYDFLVTLLDLVAEELEPTFTPIQNEGDALFAVAHADAVTGRGHEVLEAIGSTYTSYHDRIDEQHRTQSDGCSACVLLTSLELKFIVHAGSFVVQDLATRTHVAGPAVNLAHRLLKNEVTSATGLRGYALLTDPALDLLRLEGMDAVEHSETYPDAGAISGRVFKLTRAATQSPA
jgi:hypothetical protein